MTTPTSKDSDWQPVKDAARQIAFAEDRTVFHGSLATGIVGIVPSSSNATLPLPPGRYPTPSPRR